MRLIHLLAVPFCFVGLLVSPIVAALKLPAVIGDDMVIQRNASVPIWGWAAPGTKVRVTFAEQDLAVVADEQGNWRVELEPLEASWEGRTLVVLGETRIEVDNVLVGDVWLCSGQSNMQMGLARTEDGESVVEAAKHPAIRLFNVGNYIVERGEDMEAEWAACSPASAARFSGVGYFFGRKLHEQLDVPIGLINSSWGATQAEGWTPAEALAEVESLRGFIERDAARERERPRRQAEHDAKVARWREEAASAKADGRTPPPPPRVPQVLRPQSMAGSLYNSMIHPVIPFAITGIVWYQGEGNVGRDEQYRILLPTLIRAWRERWKQGEIPFGIVQLPNFKPVADEPGDSVWARLREAQWLAHRNTPRTGLAVTIDIGDADNGHPLNKRDVGLRLARWALADVYGLPVGEPGPEFQAFAIQGGKVTLNFDETDDGLRTLDGEAPRGFAIAGADRQWRWARARIVGKDEVVVSSEEVSRPVAVRYAWADNPGPVNLTNGSGLPAAPFRTDDWMMERDE